MISIMGMGYAYPDTYIDNRFLENLDVGTSEQWILEKIGIKTRVSSLPLDYIRKTRNQDVRMAREVASHSPTDLGVQAAGSALSQAGLSAADVGLLICNCCTPDQHAPTEGQRIAERLGIVGRSFDVMSACPAFALHMDFLESFEPQKLPEFVLCVSTATMTQRVNYNDRTDGAIWGDGAAAWVISPRHTGKLKTIATTFTADPSRCAAVVVDSDGYFHQDGRAVRDFSVRQTVRLIKAFEEGHALDWSRDSFIGHQANGTMLQQITNNREIPDANHWRNVELLGNQAGAGAPAVLAQHWEKIVPHQKVVVAVVGAGLSWGSILFEAQ